MFLNEFNRMTKINPERVKYKAWKIADLGEEEYRRRERRVKKYYRPPNQLSRNEKTETQERNKRYEKAFWERTKQSEDTGGELVVQKMLLSYGGWILCIIYIYCPTGCGTALPKPRYSRKKTSQSLKRANRMTHEHEIKNKFLNKQLNSAKERLERNGPRVAWFKL